ncbi:helix-hairpin-helix domain-containing protein [Halobacillus sp. B23F22_1]|uniref:helix-hairpin-helix domain-containing protein n=1 Tax=Halobacillus sp. B23F22_1 TaxID=3459514 RepID=UPI00373F6A10
MTDVKLTLTGEEKLALQHSKIKLKEVHMCKAVDLAEKLDISIDRAERLISSAYFQQIPGVGPSFARNITDLGFTKLEQLEPYKGPELLNRLEKLYECQIDPCVEDMLWQITYYARTRDLKKQWYDFTSKRKTYRNENGYPKDRPKRKGCKHVQRRAD